MRTSSFEVYDARNAEKKNEKTYEAREYYVK